MYIRSLPTNEPCPPVVSVCHLSMSYIYVHIPEPVLQHSTQGMLQDLIWHVPAVQRQKSRPTRLTVVECTWMNKLNKLNKMNKRTELSSDGSAHPDGWEAQSNAELPNAHGGQALVGGRVFLWFFFCVFLGGGHTPTTNQPWRDRLGVLAVRQRQT
uniref:Uncharacterized protein n=1 Tax=Eutreptiella gymnastica TaxID=73025 RepID=A0A7S4LFW5_9EUGL